MSLLTASALGDPTPSVHGLITDFPGAGSRDVNPPGAASFQQILGTPAAGRIPVGPDDLVLPVSPSQLGPLFQPHPANPVTPTTAGDALLRSLQALSTQMQGAWSGLWTAASSLGVQSPFQGTSVQGPAGPAQGAGRAAYEASEREQGMPTLSQVIALQVGLVEVSVMMEIAGKGTSKAIQNLNEMVKMQ